MATALPRSFCYAFADIVSWCKHVLGRRDRAIVVRNLMPVVGDHKRADACAFSVVKNFAYYLADFFAMPEIDEKYISRHVIFDGLNHLENLYRKKEKIIVFSAHLGNYELGAALLGLKEYKICVLALPHKDSKVNAFFNRQRELCGVDVAQTGAGVKKCFRALNQGHLLALVGDRDFFGQGKKVSMFGKNCVIPRGPAVIARKTGAWILPVFLVRENRYKYRYIMCEPISSREGDRVRSEDELIESCSKVLEKYISLFPEQWYLFENYWVK